MKRDWIDALQELVERAPGADAFHLRLEDAFTTDTVPDDRLEAIFAEFLEEFDGAADDLHRQWGEPEYRGTVEDPDFPAWSEALVLATWRRGEGIAYLALRHDDDHEPMFLEVGALTDDEITTLATTRS